MAPRSLAVSSVRFLALLASSSTSSFVFATHSHFAFVSSSQQRHHNIASWSSSKRIRSGYGVASSSSQSPLFQSIDDSNNDDDVFLLSIDGTLASTTRSRSWMAVCVALQVWPTLQSNMEGLGIDPCVFSNNDDVECNDIPESYEWLLQKLSALSSITQQGNSADAMLGCDAVLLARVLLEEQSLDGGRSNGRGGKYGGKFHPSSSPDDDDSGKTRSKVGSRPLTVGELYANWHELRDVTRMKYPFIEEKPDGKVQKQDPLPKIRECLAELFSRTHQKEMQSTKIVPSWQTVAYDVLFDYQTASSQDNGECINLRKNTILMLGHEAQIPLALRSLSSLGYDLDVESDYFDCGNNALGANSDSDATKMKVKVTTADKIQDYNTQEGVLLVAPSAKKEETHSAMIESIVKEFYNTEAGFNRNIYVIHSSLEVLKRCKLFLGEDAPMLSDGLRKCILPNSDNMGVTLCLPKWADNVHPTQQNDGEMDPWLNLVTAEQLLELISARIITEAPLA